MVRWRVRRNPRKEKKARATLVVGLCGCRTRLRRFSYGRRHGCELHQAGRLARYTAAAIMRHRVSRGERKPVQQARCAPVCTAGHARNYRPSLSSDHKISCSDSDFCAVPWRWNLRRTRTIPTSIGFSTQVSTQRKSTPWGTHSQTFLMAISRGALEQAWLHGVCGAGRQVDLSALSNADLQYFLFRCSPNTV